MGKIKNPPATAEGLKDKLTILAEAIAAVNRTIAAWTERHLSFNATGSANYIMHFSLRAAVTTVHSLLASGTASRAAARLIGETFLCVEILLRSGKYEVSTALTASKSFVLGHG